MTSLPVPVDDVEYRVVGHTRVTGSIVDLRLQPVDAPLPAWRPGQYALLADHDYAAPPRSYSFANLAGEDDAVRLLVTLVPDGTVSSWVHHSLQVGAPVLLSGPYGLFGAGAVDRHGPVLCLAGGSGIAPMFALAEDAVRRDVSTSFSVLFSARTSADVIDEQRWRAWTRQCPAFSFERTLTREDGEPPLGRIPGILPRLHPDLSRHDVCIAGDPAFVRDCSRAAREQGARPGHVHTEEFFAEPQPWGSAELEGQR